MRLKWIISCCLISCGWSEEESYFTLARASDDDPFTSLVQRYPYSQVKGYYLKPEDSRFTPSHNPLAQPPYTAEAVPYNAAREYGLPGLGYEVTDPYTDQVYSGYSISYEPGKEVAPEEEETSEIIISTTTTPRPTKPPLPPPPPPPPPPLPPPTHSTNSINLSPPRQSHRLPKLPPKPNPNSQKGTQKKKPKKKLEKNSWNKPAELYPTYVTHGYVLPRKYNIEEGPPDEDYRFDVVNRGVWVSDPENQRHFYYEYTIPSFLAEQRAEGGVSEGLATV